MILPLHFGRTITGSEGGQSQPEKDIPEILPVLAGRRINWCGFTSHRGSFSSLESDIIKMRSGEVGHLISTPKKDAYEKRSARTKYLRKSSNYLCLSGMRRT